jgi:putative oxidoreductase
MGPSKVILLLLRLALGGVFIYAGALKIVDAAEFARAIHNYQLTPRLLSTLLAVYLPWLEVLAGLALILRRLPLGAALALTTMSAVFLIALTSAWARGLDISCGCFSKEEHKIQTHFPQLFLRDVALLAAAATLLFVELRRPVQSRQA